MRHNHGNNGVRERGREEEWSEGVGEGGRLDGREGGRERGEEVLRARVQMKDSWNEGERDRLMEAGPGVEGWRDWGGREGDLTRFTSFYQIVRILDI